MGSRTQPCEIELHPQKTRCPSLKAKVLRGELKAAEGCVRFEHKQVQWPKAHTRKLEGRLQASGKGTQVLRHNLEQFCVRMRGLKNEISDCRSLTDALQQTKLKVIEARKAISEEGIDEYGTLSIAHIKHSGTVSLRGAER